MKGERIGYHNQNFSFNASIQISAPESGFSLKIGRTGDPFYTAVALSGYSGYIFDQSGNFVHGYRQNEVVNFSGNYFFGPSVDTGNPLVDETGIARFSYFIDDILICNNITGPTGFIDTILFEDQGGENTLAIDLFLDTGSPCVIADDTGTYILSSEGYYLSASDCV